MEDKLLGGLTARDFLRRHWQKRPLLVRRAIAPRSPVTRISLALLAALAARDDVESRLVRGSGRRWQLQPGPLTRARLARMPRRGWTLLVQGVNHHVQAAEQLLRRFAFIPQARLDDVMASHAAPGGGVGPHWDSYDVFLVQAQGRRVWRVSRPRRYAELQGAPLRIIDGFEAEDEYLLDPGDLLYLPPGWGHEGVALERSITLSVGFRAPSAEELGAAFFDHLADRGLPRGSYRDPDLRQAVRPAEIGSGMLRRMRAMLERVRWTRGEVDEFLGLYLATPKPHLRFARPVRPLARRAFARRLAAATLVLDPKTLLLYRGGRFFVNGESPQVAPALRGALRELADRRSAPGRRFASAPALALLHEWYRAGYIHLR